jgi:AmiR/NasT family two-component response regulator
MSCQKTSGTTERSALGLEQVPRVQEPGHEAERAMTILVAEGETWAATTMAAALEESGHRIIGPVATAAEALACLRREPPEVAVLDISLAGTSSASVAKALAEAGVPFVLATDHPCPAMLDAAFEGAPRVGRPFLPASLAERLRQASARARRR